MEPNPQWSNIQIYDMNDHGNCIAQATNTDGKQCVVLLLKMELDPVYGDGPDGFGSCSSFGGGGLSSDSCSFIDPDVDDIDPNGALNQITNPAGIVIEGSANDGNVAVFKIKTDLDDELVYWEIEPEGGNAYFYPQGADDNNKGKLVKINGSNAGRVKINVYAGEPDEDSEPVVFTEAIAVEPKVIPFRANIISHPDNTVQALPSAYTELPDAFKVANIILRQAGVRLESSSDQANGDLTHVLDPDNGEKADSIQRFDIQDFGSAFYIYANSLKERVEDVSPGDEGYALSINYRPDLLQITFIENFEEDSEPTETKGICTYRKSSSLNGDSLSAAYRTSSNDTFDPDMVHTLNFINENSHPDFSGLHGVLIAWPHASASNFTDKRLNAAGQNIAHEVAHAMNVLHRYGYTHDHYDGLETQLNKQLLGKFGTNVMDYGGGVDLDLLQLQILRASSVLE